MGILVVGSHSELLKNMGGNGELDGDTGVFVLKGALNTYPQTEGPQ